MKSLSDVIKLLSQKSYSDWDIVLDRNGIKNIPLCLDNICRMLRCEEAIDEMTQEEIIKYCNYGDEYAFRCIEKCIEKYEEQLVQEIER